MAVIYKIHYGCISLLFYITIAVAVIVTIDDDDDAVAVAVAVAIAVIVTVVDAAAEAAVAMLTHANFTVVDDRLRFVVFIITAVSVCTTYSTSYCCCCT